MDSGTLEAVSLAVQAAGSNIRTRARTAPSGSRRAEVREKRGLSNIAIGMFHSLFKNIKSHSFSTAHINFFYANFSYLKLALFNCS